MHESTLINLPSELLQLILSFLPDADSLLSAILTCSHMHQVYNRISTRLATQVLLNCIDAEVLPEAWINLSLYRTSHRPDTCEAVAVSELQSRRTEIPDVYLYEALQLCATHSMVNRFANIYVKEAFAVDLGKFNWTEVSNATPFTPSRSEWQRVRRAIYRFDMLCNLHRSAFANLEDNPIPVRVFYGKFAPWENEQLVCISEFLHRQVAPAYNDLTDHDIDWGYQAVPHARSYGSKNVQQIISWGLAFIETLIKAGTFAQRSELLKTGFDTQPQSFAFIYNATRFMHATDGMPPDPTINQYWPPSEYADHRDGFNIFYDDQDAGPEKAWAWGTSSEMQFVNDSRHRPMRFYGYVFYDLDRLHESAVLNEAWRRSWSDSFDHNHLMTSEDVELERRSRRRRAEIYAAGGRGWWAFGDESKVVYPVTLSLSTG